MLSERKKTGTTIATAPVKSAAQLGRALVDDMFVGLQELTTSLEATGNPPAGTVVRRYNIPVPSAYTPGEVRTVRATFGVAQAIFAELLGVSTILVKSWEQGKRVPNRMASRMLDTIAADPAAWLAMAGATVPAAAAPPVKFVAVRPSSTIVEKRHDTASTTLRDRRSSASVEPVRRQA